MDIFIMIYGYFGFLLIIGMFLYFKKVEKIIMLIKEL